MARWKRLAAAVAAVAAGALLATPGVATAAPAPAPLDPTTVRNAIAAMHGEAFAHAKYLAFGEYAASTGETRIADLFDRTAAVELGRHFTDEAELIGLVDSAPDNLLTAAEGEGADAAWYTEQATATAQSCPTVSSLFTQLATAETAQADLFTAALTALTDSDPATTVPAAPAVTPVPIVAGEPVCPDAADLLETALKSEAFDHGAYVLFAQQATDAGRPDVAALFGDVAQTELRDHFARLATLAGLVGDNADNLQTAIGGETYETSQMYPSFATQAAQVGDWSASRLFHRIGQQEFGHAREFTAALRTLP